MNTIPRILMILALIGAAGPAPAADMTINQEIDASFRNTFIQTRFGPRAAEFEMYQTKPDGFVLDKYEVNVDSDKYEALFLMKRPNQTDREFLASGGRLGKWSYKVRHSELNRIYSNETQTLFQPQADGHLEFPDGLQNAIQNNAYPFTSPGIGQDLRAAPYFTLQTLRRTTDAEFKYRLARGLTMQITGKRIARRGQRALGMTVEGHSFATELPAPVYTNTHEAGLDLQYADEDKQARFAYQYSQFDNVFNTLTWDNIRRITDANSNSARGRMALPPDNEAHSFALSGGVNLPANSRFSATLGWDYWKARNEMLPFTVNTAMTGANCPGGNPSSAACRPNDTIHTAVGIIKQTYKLSSRPADWLRASLAFDSYNMQDYSEVFNMYGYASYDDTWTTPAPFKTRRYHRRTDKTTLRSDVELGGGLSMDTLLRHEYKKQSREVDKGKEVTLQQGFTYRAAHDKYVNLSYTLAMRRMNGFDHQTYIDDGGAAGGFWEAPGLQRFDVADRNRHQARLQARWNPGESSYGFNIRVTDDRYRAGKGTLDGNQPQLHQFKAYGLRRELVWAFGVDTSRPITRDIDFDLYYEIDLGSRLVESNSSGAVLNQDAATDWTMRAVDISNVGGAAFTWRHGPKCKTKLGYDIVVSNGKTDPVNSQVTTYVSLPTTKRMLQRTSAESSYMITEDLKVKFGYVYEKFDASDWAFTDIPVLNGDNSGVWLGASLRNYYAHLTQLAFNYTF